MKVVWSPQAESQLRHIHEYISIDKPDAADKLIEYILSRVTRLELFHSMGRQTTRKNTRELVIPPYPYLVRYRIGQKQIDILSVRHGARRPQV